MLGKSIKRCLALAFMGMMISGSITVSASTVNDEVMQAAEEFSVSFDNDYAQVGEPLSVTVTGTEAISYSWYVDGMFKSSQPSYTPTASDLEKWIQVVVNNGSFDASAKLYCSKLPVVYIDTENGAAITDKINYIDATMKIQGNAEYDQDNYDDKILYDGVIEIRGRGNSTWSMPKKPYKIKLDKKTSIFDMGKNKHWVLLANYSDESLMRNTLAYNMSGDMGMVQMSTVWVDVVLNGKYVGNYQFCEQVRVGDTRVDVFDWESFAEDSAAVIAETEGMDDDTAGDLESLMLEDDMSWITTGYVDFNGARYDLSAYENDLLEVVEDYGQSLGSIADLPSLINGGYILELDEYYDEYSKFKTNSQQPIMFKNPEYLATNKDMLSYVQNYVQAFEDAVQSPEYTALYDGKTVHYSDLYDMDALVDYWVINEVFFNEELNKKSTYMYKQVDELMKMGPMWDMDYSSGGMGLTGETQEWATLYFTENAQKDMWYKDLVNDPYFLMKVQERYWEVRPVQVADMVDAIDVHYEYLKESGDANDDIWPYQMSFDADVNNLKKWMNEHLAWLDTNMATEDTFDISFITTSDSLELALNDAANNALNADSDEKAPADAVAYAEDDLILNIGRGAGISGNAQIYINGRLTDTISLNNRVTEYEIPADALTEEIETKNVIEVKVVNATNNVIASNYITVKQSNCDHSYSNEWKTDAARHWKECTCGDKISMSSHTFEWKIDKDATENENGLKHEECTVCGYTRNENTEFSYVMDPEDSSRDIPVANMIAISDSEYLPGTDTEGPDDYILDGNINTHWHTNHGEVAEGLELANRWVGVSLNEPMMIDGIRYLPRNNGTNGTVSEYQIQYRETDDGEWITAASGTWDRTDLTWKRVSFKAVMAKQVRIVGVHTYSHSGEDRHMTAAEFRVTGANSGGTVTPPAGGINVAFNNAYAEVGEALSVTVEGASKVSYSWKVGGKVVGTDAVYTPTANDLENWIEVIVSDGTSTASTKIYFSKLPVVYIDTEGGQAITSKENYIDAEIKIQGNAEYSDSKVLYDGATEIRGRGNSTWEQPKKPYRLKLDKKADAFGMGKSKHWVLLANYMDGSLMRNTLSYNLSGSMGMEQMSTVWVDVILNGKYVGNYQFCENVRPDEERIDVFDWESFAEDSAAVIAEIEGMDNDTAGDLETYMAEKDMSWITSGTVTFNKSVYELSKYETGLLELLEEDYGQSLESIADLPSLITGGYILELDEYYDEVSVFKTYSNQPMMFKNPEFVITNKDMMNYVQSYVQAFEDAVQSDYYTAMHEDEEVHYSDLYDFDALIDYWLVSEIFFNEEFNKKSTYMYKEIDELMKMGPIWDMDWSSAGKGDTKHTDKWATLHFSLNAQKNQWYKDLVKDPYFLMRAQERYWEIRDIQVQDMLDVMDENYEYLKESGAADGTVWGKGDQSFTNNYINLENWLNAHIAWMDKQMDTEDSFDSAFLEKDDSLGLTLTGVNGEVLEKDSIGKVPADVLAVSGHDLMLTLSELDANAYVFINGKQHIVFSDALFEYIPADKLIIGEKNVIEVKVIDDEEKVLAENYITVRTYEEGTIEEKEVMRISGSDRYATGYKVAEAYKAELGVDKFDAVVVATGKNFADALSGSYLAIVKEAPILLTNGKDDNVAELHAYIKENVNANGTVYILGGTAAVPETVESIEGYTVKRLAGASRYDTNLEILAEAGITGTELIVATGKEFADSLSASAAGRPILLVKPGAALSAEQKAIAETIKGGNIYVVGGTGAVADTTAAELENYATVERIAGSGRQETSKKIAEKFFADAKSVVVANAKNFPDGLCGGPLAAAMNAPLLLTATGNTAIAERYVLNNSLTSGVVLGGTGALSDEAVVDVFRLTSAEDIILK